MTLTHKQTLEFLFCNLFKNKNKKWQNYLSLLYIHTFRINVPKSITIMVFLRYTWYLILSPYWVVVPYVHYLVLFIIHVAVAQTKLKKKKSRTQMLMADGQCYNSPTKPIIIPLIVTASAKMINVVLYLVTWLCFLHMWINQPHNQSQ